MLKALFTFSCMFTLDFVWARYTIACAEKKAMRASLNAAFIYVLSGTLTITYVADPWMLIPLCLGAFAGTYASIAVTGSALRFWPQPHVALDIGAWRFFAGWRGIGLHQTQGRRMIGIMGSGARAWPWRWVNMGKEDLA